MSAQGVRILNLSVFAAEAIASQGLPIAFDGTIAVDATKAVLGVSTQPAKQGEALNLCVIGTEPAVIATAGLLAGTGVVAGAGGFVAAAAGVVPFGYLLQDAVVAGQLYEILVK